MKEGEDDVKSVWPLWAGLHTYYNGYYKEEQWCEPEQISKNNLSSDCSLQLENMKVELLVISNQHVEVNLVMDFVHTARHAMEIGFMWN